MTTVPSTTDTAGNEPADSTALSLGLALACQSVNAFHAADAPARVALLDAWEDFIAELSALGVTVPAALADPFPED